MEKGGRVHEIGDPTHDALPSAFFSLGLGTV